MRKRHEDILRLLKNRKYLSKQDLIIQLHYSESTIRRDLVQLEKMNLVKRTHGGVFLVNDEMIENPHEIKFELYQEEKRMIAELAIDFVDDYSTIFLDASSTAHYLAKLLKRRHHLKVITSNLATAYEIDRQEHNQVYLLGGEVTGGKICGSFALDMMKQISIDMAFISCRGFLSSFGASDILESEAGLKKQVRSQAKKIILLMDNSKFDKRFFFQTILSEEIDYLVTYNKPPKEYLNQSYELVYWNE